MKVPWRRGKKKQTEVSQTLEQEERRYELLASRLRSLQLELGLIDHHQMHRRDS